MFSIVYQGITTRIMPLLKVDYTSTKLSSQIYIGSINWFLLFFVLFIMYDFKESNRLAAAYGLAVTGTMTLTGIMMTCIFYLRNNILKASISMFITLIDLIFLVSNLYKIPHGGYWSIIIAFFPFVAILIYTSGQKRLYQVLNPIDKKIFIEKYEELYKNTTKIKGTSLFFARVTDKVSPYIVNTMFTNNIIYEDNIIVSITKLDSPFGVKFSFKDNLSEGLRVFNIEHGYMEFVDIEALLRKVGIDEKVIFYGVEDIVTSNIVWKIFSIMKKLSPTFVQFYRLPPDKLHGVITRVYM
jgi:KUP system potassium uptake protein